MIRDHMPPPDRKPLYLCRDSHFLSVCINTLRTLQQSKRSTIQKNLSSPVSGFRGLFDVMFPYMVNQYLPDYRI